MNSKTEVVITGLGVVTPIGFGVDDFWQALLDSKSGVRPREGFEQTEPSFRIAAPVLDFDGRKFVKPRKALKVMCRPIQFGCAAAAMATTDAGLDDFETDPDRLATVFGTETFFADPLEVADVFRKCIVNQNYEHSRWGEFAMREIQPLWMLKYLPNMVASHISIAMDARGPSNSICQGEASSALALVEGANIIRRGIADVVVVGGTGSQLSVTQMLYRGTANLSCRFDDPENACRPFDRKRDGMVVGEGAGAIILESREHAKSRNADVYATLAGYSQTYCSPLDHRFVDAVAECLNTAMESAQIDKTKIGHINLNGDGSIENDKLEAAAVASVFGNVPAAANKSNFGNLGPGTSAVEIAAAVKALTTGKIPPNINFETPDPECPVNLKPTSVDISGSTAMKLSISSTGQIVSLVLANEVT